MGRNTFCLTLLGIYLVASVPVVSADATFAAIFEAQSQDAQARYAARHPRETLEFFGIKPGMTVVEVLPGRGWYSKILAPWLGSDGRLIGADYALDMWPKSNFFDDTFLEAKKTWASTWTKDARIRSGDDGADVAAFVFGSMPEAMTGQADAVLLIRALHNLARFENDGGYLSTAMADVFRVLKPGGIVGVVQHMAPESASDEWANGSRGYLKKGFVITRFEGAGFEYVGESDINANPADEPDETDTVWRLPPSFATSRNDPDLREKYRAIGESNRMTVLFRKPK